MWNGGEGMKNNQKILMVSLLGVTLLSSCGLNIYDFVRGSTSHKEAKSDDLSSLQEAKMYGYKASGNDYVPYDVISGSLTYRKIEDVPYITVADAISLLSFNNTTVEISGDVYSHSLPISLSSSIKIDVDSEADTITFSDYDLFCSEVVGSKKVNNISGLVEESNSFVRYSADGCSYSSKGKTTFDLLSYSLDVIAYDKDVYIHFAAANEIFIQPLGLNFIYNGRDFYIAESSAFTYSGSDTLSTYGRKYYTGPLGIKGKSSNYALFNYNMLCFSIDHFYGFLDKGFSPIDEYLEKNYRSVKNGLKSTKNSTYEEAASILLYGILGDGHTGVYGYSSIFGDGKFDVSSSALSDRYISISRTGQELTSLRKMTLGASFSNVRYSSNTAIITFDEFDSAYKTFTQATVFNYQNSDTFAFLYAAFRNIASRSNVKNVVFDLSLNGGGAVDGLIGSLGFLTNDVKINLYNPLTKSEAKLSYAVDANLDGKIDSSDVKSKYSFFVLTSPYTFSCANLFANVCKEQGLATIIGEKSGGGACVVRNSVTADGLTFQMSGDSRLSNTLLNGEFQDIDDGVSPDHSFSRTSFYSDSALAKFVENL